MEPNGIRTLYEPSPVPSLYVDRMEDLLGLVPLFPCFLDGNSTSTILYIYTAQQKQAFELSCADGQGPASSRWAAMFMRSTYGCEILAVPSLKLEGFRLQKTERICRQSRTSRSETSQRAWETRTASKVAAEENGNDKYIPGKYMVYTWPINLPSIFFPRDYMISIALLVICTYIECLNSEKRRYRRL
jgi:hypothetical protein